MVVDASAVARVLGISVTYEDMRGDRAAYLPQQLGVYAQGKTGTVFSTTKRRVTSAAQAGTLYGFGSPIHLICRELFPENGDGVGTVPVIIHPLEDAYESGVASTARIIPAGSQTKQTSNRVRVGGVFSQWFTVPAEATVATRCDLVVAAVNGVLHSPMAAVDGTTDVDLTSKWAGESANGIVIEVPDGVNEDDFGPIEGGTWSAVQPTGGSVNPDVSAALASVGNVWETMMLNAMNADDEDTLDLFQAFGDGRWLPTVRRPCVAFVGNTEADMSTATLITDTRDEDKINVQLVAPGSPNLPFVVAARQLARIIRQANNDPATGYGAKRVDRIVAGEDSEQWDDTTRNAALQAGSSTVDVVDGVITIGNVVTMYHPAGETPPAFSNVVAIVRLQTAIFNFDMVFGAEEWAAAPLIPDGQATVNPNAKTPSMAKTEAFSIIDGLADAAIISDPATAKKNVTATIDPGNPNRLNLVVPLQLSGNTEVKSVEIKFGYYFGGAAAA